MVGLIDDLQGFFRFCAQQISEIWEMADPLVGNSGCQIMRHGYPVMKPSAWIPTKRLWYVPVQDLPKKGWEPTAKINHRYLIYLINAGVRFGFFFVKFLYCNFGIFWSCWDAIQLIAAYNYHYSHLRSSVFLIHLCQAPRCSARAERRIVESAVRQNGLALEWASEDLRADRDVEPWWEVSWGEWQRMNFSKNQWRCCQLPRYFSFG